MPKFHVDSIQQWDPFEHDGVPYGLEHLDCHEVVFQRDGAPINFVVTYGLHCFTKDGTEHNIPVMYADGKHQQQVCLERYESSKQLRRLVEGLDSASIYQTQGESFFTLEVLGSIQKTEFKAR